jgi:6-pyruvoyltetrahydropterin/6-carboxytetrahydropterin synthase
VAVDIFKVFQIEAAHRLPNVPAGHKCGRMHGHSFRVEVFLRGEPNPVTGWVADFAELEHQVQAIRAELDHNYLNNIAGLEVPTLENISRWIWHKLDNALPGLDRVLVRRGTCGEGCIYRGRAGQLERAGSQSSAPDGRLL